MKMAMIVGAGGTECSGGESSGEHRGAALRATRQRLGILVVVAIGLLGCSGASTDVAAQSVDQPGDAPADEEYRVGRCHAAEVVCDLSEPLIPGAGCFCPDETGETIPGTAGS